MSALEEAFLAAVREARIPMPEREYRFCPTRKFRFDFAWPRQKIAVEVQGAIWRKGAHSSGVGLQRDYEKYNLAQLLGWKLLQFEARAIRSGIALNTLKQALETESSDERS
jgi:very-short-patch-repair endonuclease